MANVKDGTPRLHLQKAQIGDYTWHVLEGSQASDAGGRAWTTDLDPYQGPPDRFEISIRDFSQGAGFTYEGPEGTYDRADGWACDAPGKPALWPLRASGAPFTTADARGWQFQCGIYLYVARGRYVCKYAINDVAGATWSIIERHDLGSGNIIAGRPVSNFRGTKAYVPIRAGTSGSLQRFHELTTVNTTTVEVQTVIISGTPTGGTYTVTFDGKTSGNIAYNAGQADFQAALRAIAGLEAVTVVTSGSVPNYTHTVTMTGVAGAMGASSPPQMTSSAASLTGGAPVISHATSSAGVTDVWTQGPASCEARNFRKWKNLLVRSKANEIFTCSGDPMTSGNWAPDVAGTGYEVGDSTWEITDMVPYDTQLLVVLRPDGVWTFNESLQTSNRLPSLEAVVDANNGIGSEEVNGEILIPHKAGLIAWQPGSYRFVGAEQEGGLDGHLSEGWGRAQSIAPYGKHAFYVNNDPLHNAGTASLLSLQPPLGSRQRGPLVPHQYQEKTGVVFEHALVIQSTFEPVAPEAPATWSDDNAVGTITWSNTSNAGAEDGAYATAAAGTSHYLKGLNPGLALPASATVVGIKASIKRKAITATTPSFRSYASAGSGGSVGTTLTITKPTGTTDGDLLLAMVEFASGGIGALGLSVTAPSGWTYMYGWTGADRIVQWYYKVAASEGASWAWTIGASVSYGGVVAAYSGVDTANPFDTNIANPSTPVIADGSNVYTIPSVITSLDYVRVVSFAAPLTTNSAISSAPGSTTLRANYSDGTLTPYRNLAFADLDQSSQGSTGSFAWTGAASSAGASLAYFTVGLRGSISVTDSVVKLVKGGAVVGDNKASASAWTSALTSVDYGGSSDLWGTTWTYSDVNASNFGIVLSATVTSSIAQVDYVTLTVYYSLPTSNDPPSYLSVVEIDSTRTIATPRIYQLPRAGLSVPLDPNLDLASSDATLYTSRYYRPARGIQKTYDAVDLWLEMDPETNTPGLEVWASVDDGTAFQLLDSTGAVATLRTTGFHQVYFPATASAVGHYVQLQFIVPALSGVEVAVAATFRDVTLRGHYRPLLTETIRDIVLVLDKGEFPDRTSEQRSLAKMVSDLSDLAKPNDTPVPYRAPLPVVERGYCVVLPPRFKEVVFKGYESSVLVAIVTLRKMVMPRVD